jgi:hypothetical protein
LLDSEFNEVNNYKPRAQWLEGKWSGFDRFSDDKVSTGVSKNILQDIGYQRSNYIDAFKDDLCTDDEQIYKFYCTNKFIVTNKSDTNTILDNSIQWLFENGFTHDAIKNSAVIVGTNILVDMWNKKIQQLNNNEEAVFLSHDYLADVDDDKGHLKELLTTKLLNSKNHSSAPPHELRLKIDDVCMLTR